MIRFLKFHDRKLHEPKRFWKQASKVAFFLANRYGLDNEDFKMVTGTVNDDFVRSKATLKITFKPKS